MIVTNKIIKIAPLSEHWICLGVILNIELCVAQIIKAQNFNNFTTSEVCSSYIALKNDPSLDPIVIRKKLYFELLKFVNKGWLVKRNTIKNGTTRFSKTKLFDGEYFDSLQIKQPVKISFEKETYKSLIAKLNHYKSELLLNIGESEAYKDLYSEHPELVDEIQPLFNVAKDNNTRILGKIRAIESLLEQDKPIEKI